MFSIEKKRGACLIHYGTLKTLNVINRIYGRFSSLTRVPIWQFPPLFLNQKGESHIIDLNNMLSWLDKEIFRALLRIGQLYKPDYIIIPGNVIACNDYVALVHPDLDRETEEILADVLKVYNPSNILNVSKKQSLIIPISIINFSHLGVPSSVNKSN